VDEHGQEQEYERRRRAFAGYQVNASLLRHAKPDAIVMHDLPAHRGEEITTKCSDGPQSVAFDQARTGFTRRRRSSAGCCR